MMRIQHEPFFNEGNLIKSVNSSRLALFYSLAFTGFPFLTVFVCFVKLIAFASLSNFLWIECNVIFLVVLFIADFTENSLILLIRKIPLLLNWVLAHLDGGGHGLGREDRRPAPQAHVPLHSSHLISVLLLILVLATILLRLGIKVKINSRVNQLWNRGFSARFWTRTVFPKEVCDLTWTLIKRFN